MASTFILFDSAKRQLLTGGLNLSKTFRCALLSSGASAPNIDTSTEASLTTQYCGNGSAGQAIRQMTSIGAVTKTATNVIKFDLSDVVFTATSGGNLSARYGMLYASAGALPLGYWELSSAEVVASQITVVWPGEGIFETSANAP